MTTEPDGTLDEIPDLRETHSALDHTLAVPPHGPAEGRIEAGASADATGGVMEKFGDE